MVFEVAHKGLHEAQFPLEHHGIGQHVLGFERDGHEPASAHPAGHDADQHLDVTLLRLIAQEPEMLHRRQAHAGVAQLVVRQQLFAEAHLDGLAHALIERRQRLKVRPQREDSNHLHARLLQQTQIVRDHLRTPVAPGVGSRMTAPVVTPNQKLAARSKHFFFLVFLLISERCQSTKYAVNLHLNP